LKRLRVGPKLTHSFATLDLELDADNCRGRLEVEINPSSWERFLGFERVGEHRTRVDAENRREEVGSVVIDRPAEKIAREVLAPRVTEPL
jgi:hypothetical protein